MRIYLAGRFSRRDEFISYIPLLEADGHTNGSRWLTEETDSTQRAVTDQQRENWAVMEMQDIAKCHVLIAFTEEPGVEGGARGGRHVEFGAAIAMEKPVVIVGPRENLFHYLPGIPQFDTIQKALNALREE